MDVWDTSPVRTSQNSWQTVEDVFETINSVSRMNVGQSNDSIQNLMQMNEKHVSVPNPNPFPDSIYNIHSYGEFENDDVPVNGLGRGQFMRNLERQFTRTQKDARLFSDLREVMGNGFSNELIEQHWGPSRSSSADTDGQFGAASTDDDRPNIKLDEIDEKISFEGVNFESLSPRRRYPTDRIELDNGHHSTGNGETASSVPLPATSTHPLGRKPRKSRNTVVLSYANRLNDEMMREEPELMKPDQFIDVSKSVCTSTGQSCRNDNTSKGACMSPGQSCRNDNTSSWPQESIFSPNDFPVL